MELVRDKNEIMRISFKVFLYLMLIKAKWIMVDSQNCHRESTCDFVHCKTETDRGPRSLRDHLVNSWSLCLNHSIWILFYDSHSSSLCSDINAALWFNISWTSTISLLELTCCWVPILKHILTYTDSDILWTALLINRKIVFVQFCAFIFISAK